MANVVSLAPLSGARGAFNASTTAKSSTTISTANSSSVKVSAEALTLAKTATVPAAMTVAQILATNDKIPSGTVIKDNAENISANLKALVALKTISDVKCITLLDAKAGTITVARVDVAGDFSDTQNTDPNLAFLKKITSSYTLKVTGLNVADALSLKSPAKTATLILSINDTIENMTSNLIALQTAAKGKSIAVITIPTSPPDTPKPSLTIMASQLNSIPELLATIKGDYDLNITGVAAIEAITVAGNADKILKSSGSNSTQAKVAVSDTSANLVKSIKVLETVVAAGRLTSIIVSDYNSLVLTEAQIKAGIHFLPTYLTAKNITLPITYDGTISTPSIIIPVSGHTIVKNTTLMGNAEAGSTVTGTDMRGNLSLPSSPVTLNVNTATSNFEIPITIQLLNDTGLSQNDRITNDPTIKGRCAPNTKVIIENDVVSGTLTTVKSDVNGNWSYKPNLRNGKYTFVVGTSQTNTAILQFTYDGTISKPTIIKPSSLLTKVKQPTLMGNGEAGSTVTLYDGNTKIASATADERTGAYSITPTTPFTDGVHKLTVRTTDVAGNVSLSSELITLTVDTATPKPILTAPSSTLLKTNKPTIAGTAEASSSVDIYDGLKKIGTVKAGTDGKFSLALTTALIEGNHSITAQATDKASNVSDISSELLFIVDTIPPSQPTISTGLSTTNINKPVITGTAEVGSTVSIYDGPNLLGTAIAVSNPNAISNLGVWNFTPTTALKDGTHSLTAKAKDVAGNISVASSPLVVTVAVEKASWVGTNGNSYLFYTTPKSWADANEFAKKIGGHLVKVNSSAENSEIYDHVLSNLKSKHDPLSVAADGGGSTYVWLGGRANLANKTWSWSYDNTSIDTKSPLWGTGSLQWPGRNATSEPDYSRIGDKIQNSLALGLENWPLGYSSGKGAGDAGHWNDVIETNKLYFVVEIESVSNLSPKSSIQ